MLKTIFSTATVHSGAGYAQQITTPAHQFTADEPERRGGTNTGPSPFELLLSSLGACTAITLRMYAERKGWDLGDIDVQLRLVKEGEEQSIERTISLTRELDDTQKARLLEIADKTPVTKALAPGVPIHTTVGPAAAPSNP
jgi:putative redox protein